MSRTKTTARHERDIADESVDPLERIRAMQAVTFDRRYEYEPLLRRFVEHPHYVIRAEAIDRLLCTWDRADLLDRAIEMALHDPSSYARAQAVSALEGFASAHLNDEALSRRIVSVFVRSLRQEPEINVQMGAHAGILLLLDGNRDYAPNHFDRETDVDWERLREYEEEPG